MLQNKYRLVNDCGRFGIYSLGYGYIVDPTDTLLFNDEVMEIFKNLLLEQIIIEGTGEPYIRGIMHWGENVKS
jgi:hypothetical protein